MEPSRPPTDADPQALACYALLVRGAAAVDADHRWRRFVDGRPISALTTPFLDWCCAKRATAGTTARLLVWDNAGWQIRHQGRAWLRVHHQHAKPHGGGHLLACFVPSTSPWLNPLAPTRAHGTRAVVSPDRLLAAQELADRVGAYDRAPHEPHRFMPHDVS